MAYNEALAARVRSIIQSQADYSERKMFGGLCLMSGDHMVCGVAKDDLMVRVGPENHDAALARPGVQPLDFTGRPMRGMVYVEPSGYESDADLHGWVEQALNFVKTLPPKRAARRRRSGR